MNSKRRIEGTLLIDHRAGEPGPSMFGPKTRKGLYESATVTCSHCHSVVVLRPNRSRERGWCFRCDRYICDGCGLLMKTQGCPGSLNKRLDTLQTEMIRSARG